MQIFFSYKIDNALFYLHYFRSGTTLASVIALIIISFFSSCRYEELREPKSIAELKTNRMSRQTHEFTCGAASLATAITLLGENSSEIEMLSLIMTDTMPYKINEEGETEILPLSAYDLENAAKSKGYKALTFKVHSESEALLSIQTLSPAICRIKLYEDFLHFVVVEGAEDGWILISDPAYGRIRIPISQFGKVWEEGDRIMLVVSKQPFLAWKNDNGQIYLKRNPDEKITKPDRISPQFLYNDVMNSLTSYQFTSKRTSF